ncbi:MAG: flavodoxin family protein [Deltaproteobacteria bacterium]|jgi:flavodoxin I
MKVLVTYYSQTGNTEKVAQAIYDRMGFVEKEIAPIKDLINAGDYDIYFVGFPVQKHSVPAEAEKFLKRIPEGKKIAIFGTHGSLRGGEMAVTAFYHALSLTTKRKVLGTFGCRGKVNGSILEKLMKRAEDRYWALEAQSASGHPDEGDLDDAQKWAWMMLLKARAE